MVALSAHSTYLTVLSIGLAGKAAISQAELLHANLQVQAAGDWAYLVLGLLMIVLLVFAEHDYRSAVPGGWLWGRFCRLSAIECGLLFGTHLVSTLVAGSIGLASGSLLIGAAALVATLAFAALAYRLRSVPAYQRSVAKDLQDKQP
jgi:hypothetical protein